MRHPASCWEDLAIKNRSIEERSGLHTAPWVRINILYYLMAFKVWAVKFLCVYVNHPV